MKTIERDASKEQGPTEARTDTNTATFVRGRRLVCPGVPVGFVCLFGAQRFNASTPAVTASLLRSMEGQKMFKLSTSCGVRNW